MPNPLARVSAAASALLVVDLQEKLMPVIHDGPRVLEQACRFIQVARLLKLPILATEQYPKGIGPTCTAIKQALGDAPVLEKLTFSSCSAEPFWAAWQALGRHTAIVCGVETHVCVQQTVLDLLQRGEIVFLLADAVGSRRPLDRDLALGRLHDAGAIVTTAEAVIFELLGRAGTPEFKEALKIVK